MLRAALRCDEQLRKVRKFPAATDPSVGAKSQKQFASDTGAVCRATPGALTFAFHTPFQTPARIQPSAKLRQGFPLLFSSVGLSILPAWVERVRSSIAGAKMERLETLHQGQFSVAPLEDPCAARVGRFRISTTWCSHLPV